MTKKQWLEICKLATKHDADCGKTIEATGVDTFEGLKRKAIDRFPSHKEKTDIEWIVAIWRYQSAIRDRLFDDREMDKLFRWAFVLLWWQDRLTEKFQQQTLMTGKLYREDKRFAALFKLKESLGALRKKAKEGDNAVQNIMDVMIGMVSEADAIDLAKTRLSIRKPWNVIADRLSKLAKENEGLIEFMLNLQQTMQGDTKQLTATQAALKSTSDQITTIEADLNLQRKHGADTGAFYMTELLDKVDRYVEVHPTEYMWKCPKCDWEGTLLKRHPTAGVLINVLDYWWVWKCPSCGNIIAHDREHPLFDGKLVWNEAAWSLVEEGKLSLKGMSLILETSPEWPLYAATTIYNKTIPAHVQEEFAEWKNAGSEESSEKEEFNEADDVPDQNDSDL